MVDGLLRRPGPISRARLAGGVTLLAVSAGLIIVLLIDTAPRVAEEFAPSLVASIAICLIPMLLGVVFARTIRAGLHNTSGLLAFVGKLVVFGLAVVIETVVFGVSLKDISVNGLSQISSLFVGSSLLFFLAAAVVIAQYVRITRAQDLQDEGAHRS